MSNEVFLTDQEALEIVLDILEGVSHIEDGDEISPTWPALMRDWCDLLQARRLQGGTNN
jgi:hypothetical protein